MSFFQYFTVIVFQIMPNLPDNHQGTSIEKMKGKIKINSGGSRVNVFGNKKSGGWRQFLPDDIKLNLRRVIPSVCMMVPGNDYCCWSHIPKWDTGNGMWNLECRSRKTETSNWMDAEVASLIEWRNLISFMGFYRPREPRNYTKIIIFRVFRWFIGYNHGLLLCTSTVAGI